MAFTGSHARLIAEAAVLALLIWKYRKNRVIAFGGIAVASIAIILLLSQLGFPDWFVGIFVLIFLLACIGFFAYACFAAGKFAYLKLRKVRPPQ
jgi:multisubunit Na+/H+ antiporter MnhF subunit